MWIDTRHRVLNLVLFVLAGALVVELVLPDGSALWQELLFGWIPVSVGSQLLARRMGWFTPNDPKTQTPDVRFRDRFGAPSSESDSRIR